MGKKKSTIKDVKQKPTPPADYTESSGNRELEIKMGIVKQTDLDDLVNFNEGKKIPGSKVIKKMGGGYMKKDMMGGGYMKKNMMGGGYMKKNMMGGGSLSPKQKDIAQMSGNPNEIEATDFTALRNKKYGGKINYRMGGGKVVDASYE